MKKHSKFAARLVAAALALGALAGVAVTSHPEFDHSRTSLLADTGWD